MNTNSSDSFEGLLQGGAMLRNQQSPGKREGLPCAGMTAQQKDAVRKNRWNLQGENGRPSARKASCRGWGYHARNEGLP